MKKKKIISALLVAAAVSLCGCGEENRENEIAYRQVGLNAMEKGDYTGAIEAFDKALALSKGRIGELEKDICYYKIDALTKNGREEDALALAESLVTYDDGDANAYLLAGNLRLSTGGEYIAYYDRAIKLSSGDITVYSVIYERLKEAGDEEAAASYIQKALDVKGSEEDDAYLRGRAVLMHLNGDYSAALDYYSSLSEQNAKDYAAIADCKFQLGDYEGALLYYTKAEDGEYEPDAAFMLGELISLEQIGEFTEAYELMETYLAAYPEDEAAIREAVFLETRAEEPPEETDQEAGEEEPAQDDATEEE